MSQIQQVSDDMNNSRTTSSYTTQHLVLQAVTFQLSKQWSWVTAHEANRKPQKWKQNLQDMKRDRILNRCVVGVCVWVCVGVSVRLLEGGVWQEEERDGERERPVFLRLRWSSRSLTLERRHGLCTVAYPSWSRTSSPPGWFGRALKMKGDRQIGETRAESDVRP